MAIRKREDREALEHMILSSSASFSDETKGREYPTEKDELRTDFQRDRDRIIHCKTFRRLSHKTQVFIAPEGDHYRTRLTHTLEVAQISRTIARALRLNEDLTEAIALGHDLGHTPFGHTGEDALSLCIAKRRGLKTSGPREFYQHNQQSLRVVEVLENGGKGLNLTREVRDGIVCHTGANRASTLEGRIVATADRIAYVNHDIDDAIRGGLVKECVLPESTHRVLGSNHSARITTLVTDMIEESDRTGDIALSPSVYRAMGELREFLFHNVYTFSSAKTEEPKATLLVQALFDYYIDHIDEVPEENRRVAQENPSAVTPDDPDCTAVVDFVAGMTDRYARSVYTDLFVPHNWQRW